MPTKQTPSKSTGGSVFGSGGPRPKRRKADQPWDSKSAKQKKKAKEKRSQAVFESLRNPSHKHPPLKSPPKMDADYPPLAETPTMTNVLEQLPDTAGATIASEVAFTEEVVPPETAESNHPSSSEEVASGSLPPTEDTLAPVPSEHVPSGPNPAEISSSLVPELTEMWMARLDAAFGINAEAMTGYVKQSRTELTSLGPEAIEFILSIFGSSDVLPVHHAVIDLEKFVPISSSLRFALLSKQKMNTGVSQFAVHYFAGLQEHKEKREPSSTDIQTVNKLCTFLKSIFTTEDKKITECIKYARSLFVTVKHSISKGKKKDPSSLPQAVGSSDGDPKDDQEEEVKETVVSCINFAMMPKHGLYINWLATSNEEVTTRKYGKDLPLLVTNGRWYKSHFALFLLRAANLAVITYFKMFQLSVDDYMILLQASTKERATHFYTTHGFEEGEMVDSESSYDTAVFPGFKEVKEELEQSTTDRIHFMFNAENIVVFKNTTGLFGNTRILRYQPGYDSVETLAASKAKDYEVTFPFKAVRNHLMILAQKLQFFYLPFQDGVDLGGFITPNRVFTDRHRAYLSERDIESIRKPSGWLGDPSIDFMMKW